MKSSLNTLKQYFKVEGENIGASCMFLVLGGVLGMLFTGLILRLEGGKECPPMGALIASIVALILSILLGIMELPRKFNLAVSMGKTRKDLIVSNYVYEVVKTLVYLVVLGVISHLEVWIFGMIHPGIEYAFVLHSAMEKLALMVGIVVGLPVLIMLIGALFMRFGQIFYWLFWVLWMVSFTVVPRMFSEAAENPSSLLGRMGLGLISFLENASIVGLLAVGALVCAVAVFVTVKLLRRQRVTF